MNVFFVFSPLQLINAVEAKEFLRTEHSVLVIVRENSLFWPLSVYEPLLKEDEWQAVYRLSANDSGDVKEFGKLQWFYLRWSLRRKVDTLLASFGHAEGLFMGRYHEPIQRHIVNTLPHRALYLLDDGTDTLFVNKVRRGLVTLPPLSAREKASLYLLGIKRQLAERVTFFSAYDMSVREGDRLILNRYQHFRSRIADASGGAEVWFLGQPLTLDGYVTKGTYFAYLRQVKDFYGDQPLVYLPHSREQEEDVRELEQALGFEVRRYGLPIEIVLSAAAERPREIVSFITSAIQNCVTMFGDTLQFASVYLEPRHLLQYHDFVAGVYEHFRSRVGGKLKILTLAELGASDAQDSLAAEPVLKTDLKRP